MAELLFVYGTLIPGLEPKGMAHICRRMQPVGEATVPGRIYDMGAYPAAVLEQDAADPAHPADPADPADAADAVIRGMLVAIDDERIWRDLDRYEGCPADRGSPGLFRRARTLATRADGTSTECWIYVYDCDLRSARPVAGGCWRSRGPGSEAGAGDSIPPSNR